MTPRETAVHRLQSQLGYTFQDRSLLDRALTHSSLLGLGRKVDHNERLEFLGDRVLGLVVAESLMIRFPQASEGELARRLNGLVSGATCARVAERIGVGEALRHVASSARKAGAASQTLLGDACEALVAAVYLDGGLEAARAVVRTHWGDELAETNSLALANPKAALQEWLAAEARPLPSYDVIDRAGPDHAPVFTVQVTASGLTPISATGRSRQDAEKAAALALLTREGRL